MTQGKRTGVNKLIATAIKSLADNGKTAAEISEELGIHVVTIYKHAKSAGIALKRPAGLPRRAVGSISKYRPMKPFIEKSGGYRFNSVLSKSDYELLEAYAKGIDVSVRAASGRLLSHSLQEIFRHPAALEAAE